MLCEQTLGSINTHFLNVLGVEFRAGTQRRRQPGPCPIQTLHNSSSYHAEGYTMRRAKGCGSGGAFMLSAGTGEGSAEESLKQWVSNV